MEVGQSEKLKGLRLTVNRAKKTKELEPAEIRLDGHVTLSNHGCSSDLEINGKEPILSDKSLAKGDRYSMDGCPKL